MKKLVTERLQEFLALNEEKYKKVRKQKATAKQPAKTTAVMDQSAVEKANQAIKALKTQLADAKKAGGMKDTSVQKKAKIKEIEDKIAKWEEKKKKAQAK